MKFNFKIQHHHKHKKARSCTETEDSGKPPSSRKKRIKSQIGTIILSVLITLTFQHSLEIGSMIDLSAFSVEAENIVFFSFEFVNGTAE